MLVSLSNIQRYFRSIMNVQLVVNFKKEKKGCCYGADIILGPDLDPAINPNLDSKHGPYLEHSFALTFTLILTLQLILNLILSLIFTVALTSNVILTFTCLLIFLIYFIDYTLALVPFFSPLYSPLLCTHPPIIILQT